MPEFKVGDRVKTADGEGEIISTKDGVWEVSIEGENDWYYSSSEMERVVEPLQQWEKELLWTPFEQSVRRHTDRIATLLIAKNKAYGDSALNPVRIFSKASRIEQLNVRIDDKISRIQRGTDFGDEDTVRDLIGYLVLRLIAEESE